MDTIGYRLREERARLGMNQDEFARLAGASKPSQVRYEKDDRSPDGNYLAALAQHGVDVSYVLTGFRTVSAPPGSTMHRFMQNEAALKPIYDQIEKNEQLLKPKEKSPRIPAQEVTIDGLRFDTVPRYDAQAAGGVGALNLDADPVDRLAFNRDWLKSQGISAGHCALITARGDSMEPRIFEGDLIMIDRRRTEIRNHHVYVFNDGDRGTRVKRLEHIPDLGVFLHSDNREKYPPESRVGQGANEITVLGEVVWSGHKWI